MLLSHLTATVKRTFLLIDCLATLEASIYAAASQPHAPLSEASRLHTVPVQYGKDAGPDFDAVCQFHAIDTKTPIPVAYRTRTPGDSNRLCSRFPYLEGLPEISKHHVFLHAATPGSFCS